MSRKRQSQVRLVAWGSLGAALLGISCQATGSAVQSMSGAMLDRLEAGEWEIRDRDPAGGRSRMCIDRGRKLVQIRHPNEDCRSFVVEDTEMSVTVHYTCPGNGYGRTRIRFENERLAQVDTQGIARGLPFEFAAEARRIGTCTR